MLLVRCLVSDWSWATPVDIREIWKVDRKGRCDLLDIRTSHLGSSRYDEGYLRTEKMVWRTATILKACSRSSPKFTDGYDALCLMIVDAPAASPYQN